jgi:diguanylate cyclase (GGDEF)-like protein/PAS domain S-box-containing protein
MTLKSIKEHTASLDASDSFQFLVDNVRDYAIYLLDENGRIAQWNRGAERLKGYAAHEIIGRHYSIFYDQEAIEAETPLHLLHVARAEGRVEAEGWRIRKDGSRLWANVVITALRDEAGRVIGFAKITRDMTLRRQVEEALRSSNEIGAQVIESVQEGITVLDRSLRYHVWNPFLERLTGISRDQVLNRHVLDVFPTMEGDERLGLMQAALQGSYSRAQVSRLPAECGRVDWVASEFIPLRAADAGITGVIVTVRDITERIEQQAKIERLTRISTVLSSINSAIVRIRDREMLLQEACRIAVTHGAFQSAWIGMVEEGGTEGRIVAAAGSKRDYDNRVNLTLCEHSPNHDRPANVAMRIRQPVICNDIAAASSYADVRDELLAKQHLSMTAFPLIVEDSVVGVLCLYADTTGFFDEPEMKLLNELAGDISFGLEYIQKDQRLNYLAYYDSVTGLPNRSFFTEQLVKKLKAADRNVDRLVVCVGDIRRLGQINESFGRKCGDQVLRESAERFPRLARNPESLAYLGNGRFASTMSDIASPAEVAHGLEKVLASAATEPFHLNGEQLLVNSAIGVAIYPHDGTTAETLLHNAEAALTRAKLTNAPYLFYEASLNGQVADALRLESKLRRALENDEFVLHYQPKVRNSDRAVIGVEALLRWNDPEIGLVHPAEFIPLLEQTGMIVEAGQWVIERALADSHACRAAGVAMPRIAVNVSVKQLQFECFLPHLRALAGRHADIGEALELEITESMVMENISLHIGTLSAVKEMGIRVAIDDFGTGYSSLSYLAKLPIDTLKIDRSFILSMTDDPASMAIVSSIISLAHSLDLDVVAEGVETEEHARFLRLLKCDAMQGYLFSRPVPLDQLFDRGQR